MLAVASSSAPAQAPLASGRSGSASAPASGDSVKGNSGERSTLSVDSALARISREAGIVAVADSTVAGERVPASVLPAPGPAAAPGAAAVRTAEHRISALVRALPAGTTFAKLYLPAPAKGRVWPGDDVAAYAYAQARLFGAVGANPPAGFVEILGQRLPESQAQEQIAALRLRPVYLVTNPSRKSLSGDAVEPWAAMTRNQWLGMTREQQQEFGRQQAQQIMSMPPEQREQVLQQMKQMDHFMDSVKDPLEKMVGHDL